MSHRIRLMLGSVLVSALAFGITTPLGAAPPELVINDMDSARAHFEDSTNGWHLSGDVSYVYADSVRYGDGWVSRPHTDVDVTLWACPPDGSDCVELRGTTNLGGMPDAADFTSMTSAWVEGVTVNLCEQPVVDSCPAVAVADVSLEWEAHGPITKLRQITPGVQTLVGKERSASVVGTVAIDSTEFPATFESFVYTVMQNYNEVYHGG